MLSKKRAVKFILVGFIILLLVILTTVSWFSIFYEPNDGEALLNQRVGFVRSVYEGKTGFYVVVDDSASVLSELCSRDSISRPECDDSSSRTLAGTREVKLSQRVSFITYNDEGKKNVHHYSPRRLKSVLNEDLSFQEIPFIISVKNDMVTEVEEIYDPLL